MQQRFDELTTERVTVVSDLHIGLPYFRYQKFADFLSSLGPDTALVLNGDVIDDPEQKLDDKAEQVLDLLRSESYVRDVFWVHGNHDDGIRLGNPGEIRFCRHLEIGKRLLIVHGDDFDDIMPKSLWFIRLLKTLHNLRIRLGARPVHIAEFARKWFPFLYRILTEEVKNNAVQCALENGFSAITCGHTHYAEDTLREGVRYLNTGTWTEEPTYCLRLTDDELDLIQV